MEGYLNKRLTTFMYIQIINLHLFKCDFIYRHFSAWLRLLDGRILMCNRKIYIRVKCFLQIMLFTDSVCFYSMVVGCRYFKQASLSNCFLCLLAILFKYLFLRVKHSYYLRYNFNFLSKRTNFSPIN